MKKIDLHIHTKATISDADFEFSLSKLQEYITSQNIDCIAITNHNKFDLMQFNEILASIEIDVLPGIEINFEKGHLLLISQKDELEDFNAKCRLVEERIQAVDDHISLAELHMIFPDLNKYLLIPHYDKNPNVPLEVVNTLSDFIKAGEVSSVKKFIYCIQDQNSLVPTLFSDCRLTSNTDVFSTKQTYIDLDTISFRGIKSCLGDKNKVSLSLEDGNDFFQATSDGLLLSTGLNIILGERSSGKTYTLEKIYNENNNVKYIKQFSLLKNDESEFKSKIANEEIGVTERHLKEFKDVVADVSKINLDENERDIDIYLTSLLRFASETATADVYSKAQMYNENNFDIKELSNLEALIDATELLISNEEYAEVIEQHVQKSSLKSLFLGLVSQFYLEKESSLKKLWLNDLINSIKSDLRTRSTQTAVSDIDFYRIVLEREKVKKYKEVVQHLKNEKEIDHKGIGKFQIVAQVKIFYGAQELKTKSGKQWAFSTAFSKYAMPYKYLLELKKIEGLLETDYYKYFVNIDYKILNSYGYEVSGGERAEFNLLNEIQDALKHDILLIDEPESSFDNLFLKDEVNILLKDMSQKIPVVIVTHNNTVGATIKPNYILYTKREIRPNGIEYKMFSGYPSDKKLKNKDGEEIDDYYVVMSCLEAGDEAYNERRTNIYEILKD